ncbi:MAG TPA: hypothetical protein VHW96_10690 [Solirubrobacteraceae bacterium]|nr:hypothetical protein [Solirubrobacteraceae bacterium]
MTGLAVTALAACGSSKPGSGGAAGPAVQALSYFPTTSPFVLTAATNPKAAAVKQLQHESPSYAVAATALFAQLSKLGIDYNADVRPLFGNPVVAGVVSTSGFTGGSSDTDFLVVWVTKSAAKLSSLIGKLHLTRSGTHDGATLYSAGHAGLAISGATLFLARSPAVLDAALDRHAGHQGFDADAYAKATAGVPAGGLVTAFGDLTPVLSAPDAAKARQVPWVGAITGYSASMNATQNAVKVTYHIATAGKPLSVSQLPIASGTSSPEIAGTLPVGLGIRDPAQIIAFVADAIQTTQPAKWAKYRQQAAALQKRSGVDITSVEKMLTGQLNLESDTHTTIARAQVSDPSAMQADLAKMVKARTGKGTARVTPLGGGLYEVRSGTTDATVGVIDGQLVVGKATPAQLRAFAAAPASNASTGTGAVTFRVALPDLLRVALKAPPSPLASQLLGMLGVITGSAEASTDGLTGTVSIPVK